MNKEYKLTDAEFQRFEVYNERMYYYVYFKNQMAGAIIFNLPNYKYEYMPYSSMALSLNCLKDIIEMITRLDDFYASNKKILDQIIQ